MFVAGLICVFGGVAVLVIGIWGFCKTSSILKNRGEDMFFSVDMHHPDPDGTHNALDSSIMLILWGIGLLLGGGGLLLAAAYI